MPPKNVPGVCPWCSDKGVNESSEGLAEIDSIGLYFYCFFPSLIFYFGNSELSTVDLCKNENILVKQTNGSCSNDARESPTYIALHSIVHSNNSKHHKKCETL